LARARKSHDGDEEKIKSRQPTGLQPYSSHVSGHRYVLYATYAREGETVGRVLVLKFLGTFAAKRMALLLINKDEFTWDVWREQHAMIVTDRGVHIHAHGDQMKEIMEHEFTTAEDEWRDASLTASCNRLLFGRTADIIPDDELPVHSPRRADKEVADGKPDRKVSDNRPSSPDPKPKRVPKDAAPRADTSGHISAGDIAKTLGVEPREVRAVLRGSDFTKPSHGWSWPAKEAEGIKEQIAKALKKIAKGKKK
jgi:hypothetical protein